MQVVPPSLKKIHFSSNMAFNFYSISRKLSIQDFFSFFSASPLLGFQYQHKRSIIICCWFRHLASLQSKQLLHVNRPRPGWALRVEGVLLPDGQVACQQNRTSPLMINSPFGQTHRQRSIWDLYFMDQAVELQTYPSSPPPCFSALSISLSTIKRIKCNREAQYLLFNWQYLQKNFCKDIDRRSCTKKVYASWHMDK